MSYKRVVPVFDTLKRTIDDLAALVDDQVRTVNSRDRVTQSLKLAVEELGMITNACQEVRESLDHVLVKVERAKHDCQLALTPVCTLPTEILSYIFELAIAPGTDRYVSSPPPQTIQILQIAQVCTMWRKVARAYSALWANLSIDQHMPVDTLKDCVTLSKGKPLHIVVCDRVPKSPLIMQGLSPTWPINAEHLLWTSSANPTEALVKHPSICSALKTLHVRPSDCGFCEGATVSLRTEFFIDLDFPQLEELSLERVDIPDIDGVYIRAPLLTSLRLSRVYIDIDILASLLAELPTLEALDVGYLHSPHSEPQPVVFRLPSLRSLTMRHLVAPMRRQFLRPDHYPSLRHWGYSAHDVGTDDPGVGESARITEFVAGLPSLESISAICGQEDLKAIFLALDSAAGLPCAPGLRSLDLAVPPETIHMPGVHDASEAALLRGVIPMLHRRKEAKLPGIERLVLQSCSLSDLHITTLKKLVTRVVVEPCEVRDVNAPLSDSAEGEFYEEEEEEWDDEDEDDDDEWE